MSQKDVYPYIDYEETIRALKAQNESCRKALERISRAASSDEAKHRTDRESLAYAVIQARCALSILELEGRVARYRRA